MLSAYITFWHTIPLIQPSLSLTPVLADLFLLVKFSIDANNPYLDPASLGALKPGPDPAVFVLSSVPRRSLLCPCCAHVLSSPHEAASSF
eukprot:664682-Pelagomonas_calceolata.AAC.2